MSGPEADDPGIESECSEAQEARSVRSSANLAAAILERHPETSRAVGKEEEGNAVRLKRIRLAVDDPNHPEIQNCYMAIYDAIPLRDLQSRLDKTMIFHAEVKSAEQTTLFTLFQSGRFRIEKHRDQAIEAVEGKERLESLTELHDVLASLVANPPEHAENASD